MFVLKTQTGARPHCAEVGIKQTKASGRRALRLVAASLASCATTVHPGRVSSSRDSDFQRGSCCVGQNSRLLDIHSCTQVPTVTTQHLHTIRSSHPRGITKRSAHQNTRHPNNTHSRLHWAAWCCNSSSQYRNNSLVGPDQGFPAILLCMVAQQDQRLKQPAHACSTCC